MLITLSSSRQHKLVALYVINTLPFGEAWWGFYTILKCANFNNSCFVPVCSNCTVALRFSPEPSIFVTVPLPKRWCSMTSPTFREEACEEADEEVPALEFAALPPFVMARETLDQRPLCLSFCSKEAEKGLTACSARCGAVAFGLGSAMNCPATGREFCMRLLRCAYPSPQA